MSNMFNVKPDILYWGLQYINEDLSISKHLNETLK